MIDSPKGNGAIWQLNDRIGLIPILDKASYEMNRIRITWIACKAKAQDSKKAKPYVQSTGIHLIS